MPTACVGPRLSCQFPDGVRQPRIEADFSGGTITSNAGALLAGLAARDMNLFGRLGACFHDLRCPELTVRGRRSLAGQRVPGILHGHEDPSDHDELWRDPALGAVPGCLEPRRADCAQLAGKSTLNRFELSGAGAGAGKARKTAAGFGKMDRLMADLFMEKHARPPEEIITGPEALTRRLRARWPVTRIILRTDFGFCRVSIMCPGADAPRGSPASSAKPGRFPGAAADFPVFSVSLRAHNASFAAAGVRRGPRHSCQRRGRVRETRSQ